MKLLLIGLDGGTWDVFDDYLLEQWMPNLKKLRDESCHGILDSTEPPVTPPAWTTCITGCHPGKHGVVAFHKYSFEDSATKLTSSADCLVPNIFQRLSEQDYKVGFINAPWTYPCQKVNGITIAGLGCPDIGSDFTYPPEFKSELLSDMNDYNILHFWKKTGPETVEKLDENVKKVERNITQRVRAAEMISERVDWDFLMVQFQDLDKMQHSVWGYVDKASRDLYPLQRDRLFEMFGKLDSAIGKLISLAGTKELAVVVASDHGFGRVTTQICPNTALSLWGYLDRKYPFGSGGRLLRRLSHKLARLWRGKKPKVWKDIRKDFNWKRSKAAVTHSSIYGFVHLNTRKRAPGGNIERGSQEEDTTEQLRRKFSEIRDPATDEKVFHDVLRPEALFGAGATDAERFGDLVLIPKTGYKLKLTDSGKIDCVRVFPQDKLDGWHYPEGMYIISGPGIRRGLVHRTHIVNIAPTLYAILGAKLPTFMDGKVISEAFTEQVDCRYETVSLKEFAQQKDMKAMMAEEEELVSKRLEALGYLD